MKESESPFPSGDTSTIIGALIYRDCTHRWWQKARDWLRLRRHPEAHPIVWLDRKEQA